MDTVKNYIYIKLKTRIMKRSLRLLLVLVVLLAYNGPGLFAAADKFELKTSEATLTIDQKGNLKIIQDQGQIIKINTSINNLWKITMKNNLTGKESVIYPDKGVKLIKTGDVLQLKKDDFSIGTNSLPVSAEFTISVKDDAFCFSGNLKSNSKEWEFKELTYPDISGIKINSKGVKIYWPESLGECYDNPGQFGSKSFEYPGTHGSMAWYSVNSPESGFYIGGHDPQRGSKKFSLSFNDSDNSFNTVISFPVYSNEFKIPDVIIKPYKGSWHSASKFYRAWFDENFKLATNSQWIRDNAG